MTGLIANNLANPDYSWEINRKSEAGLDLGFFKDRLLASISYYYNRSSNQIVATPLPGITGFTSITANLPALVQNTGLEADLNATILKSAAFTWKASFNISFPKNKLVSFPGLENSAYAYQYVIGQPLRISKLYNLKGVDPLTGIYQFFDSGGKTTFNPAYPQDATNIIDYAPKYYGGFFNSFQWNHWQLDIFLQFTKQTGSLSLPNYAPGQLSNQSTAVLAHWQKPGEQTNTQKFTAIYGDTYNAYSNAYSALSVADASFLRLKNLSLSYMFTSAFLTGIHLNSLRVYIQAQNLFTITSYKGLDPETQGALPPIKLITAGIQLSL
jgi:hypothetical protein